MNINELTALRRLWASPAPDNLNLAFQLTFSQNLPHLLEAEMLVAGLFCADIQLVNDIENYFSPFCEHSFLLFAATFHLYPEGEKEITRVLYSNWQRLAAIHHRLKLAELANAFIRFTGFGTIFVLENNLSELIDYELFVTALYNKINYESQKTDYENGLFVAKNNPQNWDLKLSLPDFQPMDLPRAVYELSELQHLELQFPHADAVIPSEFSRFVALEQISFFENDEDSQNLPFVVPDLSILSNVKKWTFHNIKDAKKLENFLSKIPNAESIELKNCNFTRFPVSDRVRQQLKNLIIDDYPHKILPPDIAPLPNLQKLNIYDCAAKRFPLNFAQLVSLEQVRLVNFVRLRKFPPFLSACRVLKELDFYTNLIKDIPSKIAYFQNLTHFAFVDTLAEKLPAALSRLANLKTLWLKDSYFKKFPAVLSQLPAIETINFQNNFLDSFENILPLAPSLQHLYLAQAFNKDEVKDEFIAFLNEQNPPALREIIQGL